MVVMQPAGRAGEAKYFFASKHFSRARVHLLSNQIDKYVITKMSSENHIII